MARPSHDAPLDSGCFTTSAPISPHAGSPGAAPDAGSAFGFAGGTLLMTPGPRAALDDDKDEDEAYFEGDDDVFDDDDDFEDDFDEFEDDFEDEDDSDSGSDDDDDDL